VDYCTTIAKVGDRSNVNQVEYHCTPDMVKQLAMIENSDMGKTARLYFLDCETKANEKQVELEHRQSLKIEFKPMTDAVKEAHEDPQPYHYSNESDMINRIVLGMSSKQYREHHKIGKKENVRDYMTDLEMKAVLELQRANTVFITMGEDYKTRRDRMTSLFNKRFKVALIEEVKELEG
jgi:phage anti-repressor protein